MKSIFFKIFCIFLLTFQPFILLSQAKIKVEIEDVNDNILYLLKYKSDKTYIVIDSTSRLSGKNIFENKSNYKEGIYLLADSKQNPLFEILLGKDQTFSIHIEGLMDLENYKVKGSKETASYFDIYSKTYYNELYIKALESEKEYFPDNGNKIDSLKISHREYLKSMLSEDSNSFLNTYIQFISDNSINDMPLCDVRILNSRLLKNKLDKLFNEDFSTQKPNIICQKIDTLISKANCQNYEVRDYILWYLYSKYFSPENIENELVYIHLVDNYFSKLEIVNLTESIRNEMIKRANVLRDITLGQQAPTLSYIDDNGNHISLEKINSNYIVLFFYKPDCQKCIRDKRILETIRKEYNDITILAINISEDNYKNVSQDIINQYDIMTTPTIYLLDKDKNIIAKHIKAEEIDLHINKNKR